METAQNSPGYLATITDNGRSGDYGLGWKIAKAESEIRADVNKVGCDISKEVGDSECDILTKVGDAECSINKEINESTRTLGLHIANAERDLQNRSWEARLESLRASKDLSDLIGYKVADVKNQLVGFERNTDENFCKVRTEIKDSERRILDRLSDDKLDDKNQKINELLNEKYADKHAYNFALQNQELNYLKQMINSVEQTQKFSSKTVQFGAGNVALPTQTANQG